MKLISALRRIFKKDEPWKVSRLISPHGLVYTVRDRAGEERQVQSWRTNQWTPESQAKFSSLPMYEEWHRNEYTAAMPYEG